MSTVEAMSAGAVPIVLDTAGARDSVRHGVDGIRWSVSYTHLDVYKRQPQGGYGQPAGGMGAPGGQGGYGGAPQGGPTQGGWGGGAPSYDEPPF